jgi:hypothetical protein
MNIDEFKEALKNGKIVYWSSFAYKIKENKKGSLNIVCNNGYAFPFTEKELSKCFTEKTLNINPYEFQALRDS